MLAFFQYQLRSEFAETFPLFKSKAKIEYFV